MPEASLLPQSAFVDLPTTPLATAGVHVRERRRQGLVLVLAKNGRRTALAERVHDRYRITLTSAPRRTINGAIAFLGVRPDGWLAVHELGAIGVQDLQNDLGDLASLSVQSDGYAILRLSGAHVRDALAKMIPLDLHPTAFTVNNVAATLASHVGVILWRLADRGNGHAVFDVAVFRSHAQYFWETLATSAAEFGVCAPPIVPSEEDLS